MNLLFLPTNIDTIYNIHNMLYGKAKWRYKLQMSRPRKKSIQIWSRIPTSTSIPVIAEHLFYLLHTAKLTIMWAETWFMGNWSSNFAAVPVTFSHKSQEKIGSYNNIIMFITYACIVIITPSEIARVRIHIIIYIWMLLTMFTEALCIL